MAMCWVALDRLLRLHAAKRLRVPADRFAREKAAIRVVSSAGGFNQGIGSYVSVLDGDAVDASLLQLARYGYTDPTCERMRVPWPRSVGSAWSQRTPLPLSGRRRASARRRRVRDLQLLGVTAQALGGDLGGASKTFERLSAARERCRPVRRGLDPESGAALGNFPQAFTHVGLIDAALTLAGADRRHAHSSELPAKPKAATPPAGRV